MVGYLRYSFLQFVYRPHDYLGKPHEEHSGNNRTQGGNHYQPPHHLVGPFLHARTLCTDGRHVDLHDAQQVFAHELQFLFRDGVAQRRHMPFEGRGNLLLIDFRNIPLLHGETLPQVVPRNGILPDVVERTEHVGRILQRRVIVGKYGFRSLRKLPDITGGQHAEQQYHGEQNADSQCKPLLYLHSLR